MRRPIEIEMAGGKGARQRVWEAIRRTMSAEKTFRAKDVMPPGVTPCVIRTYLSSLMNAGILTRQSRGAYQLVKDTGLEAPRVCRDGSPIKRGLAQEQMWRTLRILKGDTNAIELAAHAATATVPIMTKAARQYLWCLHRAGYLACTSPGKSARGLSRYRLVKNTGPRPPMLCKIKSVVYDPNLGKVVWTSEITEEDAIYGN